MKTESLDQIKATISALNRPVRLVTFTRDAGCEGCPETVALAREIKALSPKIALENYDLTMDRDKAGEYGIALVPSIVVEGGDGRFVVFSGMVEYVFLSVMVDTISAISSGKVWFPDRIRDTVRLLERDVHLRVFVDADCPLCKPVAETAIGLAFESELVFTNIIIASDFPDLIKRYSIKLLPKTIFGENIHMDGHVTESQFLELIFQAEGLRPGGVKNCLICGKEAQDIICNACKTKIQAEAVEHKIRIEKGLKHP